MIRLCFSAGVARIVELQLNSLTTHKSTDGPTGLNATSVSLAAHGSDATKVLTKHLAELQTKNSGN